MQVHIFALLCLLDAVNETNGQNMIYSDISLRAMDKSWLFFYSQGRVKYQQELAPQREPDAGNCDRINLENIYI